MYPVLTELYPSVSMYTLCYMSPIHCVFALYFDTMFIAEKIQTTEPFQFLLEMCRV